MISFDSGPYHLCQTPEDLPRLPDKIPRLFADFETSSGSPQKDSLNPFYSCRAIGAAISFDPDPSAPIWFVPRDLLASGWWRDVLCRTLVWVNHHAKYDVHVSINDLQVTPMCELWCTVNRAKLIDSDRIYSGGYGLDVLCKQDCGFDMGGFGDAMRPYLENSKDYGDVPIDILAEYACVDVYGNKLLYHDQNRKFPTETDEHWRTEVKTTSLLVEMEQQGLLIKPLDVKKTQIKTMREMLEIDLKIEELTGQLITATSNKDCYDLLVNHYGLPVLGWTEGNARTGAPPQPSFDKDVLKLYLDHPAAPAEVVQLIQEYRWKSTFNSLFLTSFLEKNDNGIMHVNHNQRVRTGRMSVSDPNPQQFDEDAKELILCPEGYGLICCDLSQIEYRILIHYLQNERCMKMYHDDPWTDFHQAMAEIAGISRDAAKTLNFACSFGMGQRKTIAALRINKKFVGPVVESIKSDLSIPDDKRREAIDFACEERAKAVYSQFHSELPELKPVSRRAAEVCKARGYVRNHWGCHRNLIPTRAHTALSSLCQSSNGDLMKDRMVFIREEMPFLKLIANVHDELLWMCPLDRFNESTCREIVWHMSNPTRPFSLPIRAAVGMSTKNWREAKSDAVKLKFFRKGELFQL